jgi:hypothetical protein
VGAPLVIHPANAGVVAPPVAEKGMDYKGLGLKAGASLAWGFKASPLTAVAGAGLGMLAANHEAQEKIIDLLNEYRNEAASALGIPAEQVDRDALREFAERHKDSHPELLKELNRIENNQSSSPVISVASGGAGMLAGAMIGGPVGLAAACAIPWAVEKTGGAVLGRDDEPSAHSYLAELSKKWKAGEPVSQLEVFTAFVRMDHDFQKHLELQNDGIDVMNMEPEERIEFFRRVEPNLWSKSGMLASAINYNHMSPLSLQGVNVRQLVGEAPVVLTTLPLRRRQPRGDRRRSATGGIVKDDAAVNDNARAEGAAGEGGQQPARPVVGAFTRQVIEARAAIDNSLAPVQRGA